MEIFFKILLGCACAAAVIAVAYFLVWAICEIKDFIEIYRED